MKKTKNNSKLTTTRAQEDQLPDSNVTNGNFLIISSKCAVDKQLHLNHLYRLLKSAFSATSTSQNINQKTSTHRNSIRKRMVRVHAYGTAEIARNAKVWSDIMYRYFFRVLCFMFCVALR